METRSSGSTVTVPQVEAAATPANWVVNATVLWNHRHTLGFVAAIALLVSLCIACAIPKRYESTARIMPPENSGTGAAMLAALAGHALGELGGLGSLAGGLLGGRNTSALFVDLLRSGTVSGRLIDRFDLQHAYHKRYRVDTAKYLAHHTTVMDDKKSGVITITVQDTEPRRARDLAQGYLDELNLLVNRTNTSSAHQERIFIERRLKKVEADLEHAQLQMSEFSSTHTTIDIAAQTRAMVDSAAKLQGEMIFGQSELDSLQQIYGDNNIRVRAAHARVAELQRELTKMSGTSAPLTVGDASPGNGNTSADGGENQLYPPLRQLPRLAVPYADLYRQVKVQETVYELLTQQYEIARIQEAKELPVVSVIDFPGIPEKKSFPPRLLLTLALTIFVVFATAAYIVLRHRWRLVDPADPRKVLAKHVVLTLQNRVEQGVSKVKGTR
ncbi:MAG TPA: Wzz/FepE/Etk N-terminal domain-containing protein [Acidobacteriaceae bacterium]|jgi:capsule polysaccharide export protein KpsE/RkpR|nr:Wzz/FepE/Etk N-terminal domain-containing protein [Acidobacteriaceae bacterium]